MIPANVKQVAWNEDTACPYQFSILKKWRFEYVISEQQQDGSCIKKTCKGIIKYTPDTLYLVYEGAEPARLQKFLVVEVSGSYLIQHFTNDAKPVFLHFINMIGNRVL